MTRPHTTPHRRRAAARPASLAAAALCAAAAAGCLSGELADCCSDIRLNVKAEIAAEKAYLHREDIYSSCCSSPKDFKQGFKNGYVEVTLNGEDCCAPPTPPKCYWGSADNPCERVELLNCYYDGWAHGAIAAGQDGVAGAGFVPIRNVCGEYGPAGKPGAPPAYGPDYGGFGAPPPLTPGAAPGGRNGAVPPPAPAADPAPMPTPLPLPFEDGLEGDADETLPPEDSVGGRSLGGDDAPNGANEPLLDRLLDAAEPADAPGGFDGADLDADPAGPPAGEPFGRASLDLGDPPARDAALPAPGTATLDLPGLN